MKKLVSIGLFLSIQLCAMEVVAVEQGALPVLLAEIAGEVGLLQPIVLNTYGWHDPSVVARAAVAVSFVGACYAVTSNSVLDRTSREFYGERRDSYMFAANEFVRSYRNSQKVDIPWAGALGWMYTQINTDLVGFLAVGMKIFDMMAIKKPISTQGGEVRCLKKPKREHGT